MPTRHRDALSAAGPHLGITRHPHGCLMIFPAPQWAKFCEHIASLSMDAQWYRRIFLGNAQEVEMDTAGRILLAPELRTAVGIGRDAVLLGVGSHLELWDATAYQFKEDQEIEKPMHDVFKDISI